MDKIKQIVAWVLSRLMRIEVIGKENLSKCEGSTIIIPNHVSLLDGVLIELFVGLKKTFFVDSLSASKPLYKFFLSFISYYKIDLQNPFSLKKMLGTLKVGGNCVIFPEGRITVTTGLMKIQPGAGMIADRGNHTLLPIWISGPERSPLSYTSHKFRARWFPKTTIYIGEPFKLNVEAEIKGVKRRKHLALQIFNALERTALESQVSSLERLDIFDAFVEAAKREGFGKKILQDHSFQNISYGRIILGALVLGRKLHKLCSGSEYVGYMLPSSNGSVVTYFAMQAYGMVPAILNFSSGQNALKAAVESAQLKHVVTSRKFIENGKLDHVIEWLEEVVEIIYLEDVRESISIMDKLRGKLDSFSPSKARHAFRKSADQPATVLFTSGSEGAPKGVVLSSRNILSNVAQINSRWDMNPTDKVLNALPIFHSFGLVMGTLYPLLTGISVFMYPSPLHYRIIPQIIYEVSATIFIATDTFLTGYAAKADAYDFFSLRLIVAGAEKLKDKTRKLYSEKFGVRIIEGYGATEASPVITCNTPLHNQTGSVGRALPGIECMLEAMPGMDEDVGKLMVKGPNMMLGYLKVDAPGKIQKLEGWYDTGDIVSIDGQGFITIRGRVKRFVKIGGEMVSLNAVEALIQQLREKDLHAAISIPSEKKGEEIILVTESQDLDRKEIAQFVKEQQESELLIPRRIIHKSKIPLLGTGKVDYPQLKNELLQNLLQ